MSNKAALFFLLFARFSGFFLFSPFFSNRLGLLVRFSLSFGCALIVVPLFFHTELPTSHLPFILLILKEILVGFLLGFLFSLLFEAASFAGQVITTMGGLSIMEIFDTQQNSHIPLLSQLFSLTVMVLFLVLDMHHAVLRLLYESFSLLPLGMKIFQEDVVASLIVATGKMFHYALSYALFPLVILLAINILFAILSRDFMIFLNGFPIQVLLTFVLVALSISNFDKILIENFTEFFQLAKKILIRMHT